MEVLFLKLVLTPLLIGAASLAGRRFGPAVGGWLVGLPLTSGPVALFLALERGTAFAAVAAEGTLVGLASVAAFCLAYGLLAPRLKWPTTLVLSVAAFFGAMLVLGPLDLPLPLSFLVVIGVLAGTLRLLPRRDEERYAANRGSWDLPARIVVATAFIVLLTGSAGALGSRLSGLLAPLPIFAGVLAVFVHHQQGGTAAAGSVRGTVVGSFAFAAFFVVLAALVKEVGLLAAFASAILSAAIAQGVSLHFLRTKD